MDQALHQTPQTETLADWIQWKPPFFFVKQWAYCVFHVHLWHFSFSDQAVEADRHYHLRILLCNNRFRLTACILHPSFAICPSFKGAEVSPPLSFLPSPSWFTPGSLCCCHTAVIILPPHYFTARFSSPTKPF